MKKGHINDLSKEEQEEDEKDKRIVELATKLFMPKISHLHKFPNPLEEQLDLLIEKQPENKELKDLLEKHRNKQEEDIRQYSDRIFRESLRHSIEKHEISQTAIVIINAMRDKYFDLVKYARRKPRIEDIEYTKYIEDIKRKYPDEVSKLGDDPDWEHGFNSGMLAALRFFQIVNLSEEDKLDDDGDEIEDLENINFQQYGYPKWVHVMHILSALEEFPSLDT